VRITSVISDKGGDTKTTTVNALATGINHLHPKKCKTLAITNEPSGHLPFFFGLDRKVLPTMYHVGHGDLSFSDAIQHTDRGDLISGNGTVNWMDSLWSTPEEKLKIYNLIKDNLNDPIIAATYSHAFIDCKPLTDGTLTIQSLLACDDVIIPMKASAASIVSLDNLYDGITEIRATHNPNLRIAGILITRFRYTGVERGHIENLKEWAQIHDTKVYKTIIPDGVGIEEAQGISANLFKHRYGFGKDKPTKAYIEFIKEYIKEERDYYGK
jgi:chromosome partitioning protein